MSVQITIRNIPDDVRDELASRAAKNGQSMQEFLRTELERIARRPSLDQWLAAARAAKANDPKQIPARELLELRDSDRK